MNEIKNQVVVFPIVRFQHTNEKGVLKFAIDQTQHYYEEEIAKGETVSEKIYTVIQSFHPLVLEGWSFDTKEVEKVEVVGQFQYEINDPTIKWNTFSSFVNYPHLKPLENRKADIIIAGNVSPIFDLRFIQLTEQIVMGYTTTLQDDEFNRQSDNRLFKKNADVYFFTKIGYFTKDGSEIGIYRYASDMFITSNNEQKISWVLGTGTFDISDTKTRISQKISN